jgi:hypothetical protein
MFGSVAENASAAFINETYYSEVNTMQLGSYYVFIHASNEYSSGVYSHNVTVIIDYPCVNDTFWVDKDRGENNASFSFVPSGSYSWEVIKFEEVTSTLSEWSVNIVDRLKTDSPDGYCNVTNYRIDKVLDSSNQLVRNQTWQNYFYLTVEGNFVITKFDKAYGPYRVFIAPFNGQVWGNFYDEVLEHTIEVTFIQADFVVPNMPPFFDRPLMPMILEIPDNPADGGIETYYLPAVLDGTINGTTSVEAKGLKSYMTFDNSSMKLSVDMTKVTRAETVTLTLKLCDNLDECQDISLKIFLVVPFKEIVIVEEEEVEEFIPEWVPDLTPNMSASVESVS